MAWWPEMRRSRGCRASCVWSSRMLWGSRGWCGVRGNPGRCAVSDPIRPGRQVDQSPIAFDH